MKTILLLILLSLSGFQADAQAPSSLQSILEAYLQLKDALVKSNSKTAVDQAGKLQSILQSIKSEELEPVVQQHFSPAKTDLLAAVQKIAKKADLEKQRAAFGELSALLWPLFKGSESTGQTLYYQYCPMKKSYWLSTEAVIRNPYYGAAMLSCGNIAEQKN